MYNLIFDLDGTLIRTDPMHRYIIARYIMGDYQRPCPDEAEFRRIIDMIWFHSGDENLVKDTLGLEKSDFWKAFARYDTPEMREAFSAPYTDASFVRHMKARGHRTGIVTSATKRIADLEVGMIGPENFDEIVLARKDNGLIPKPDPSGLYRCMELLGSTSKNTIFFGDSPDDIQAGQSAGVLDIHVDRGEFEYQGPKPTITVLSLYDTMDELGI
ncbi:MAG: HAD-IA family hydrolase [Candidatus Aenigmatarchaeota archaeon]|nr:HAD family hydrolase [Nanoarchaeota archaeon]